MSVTHTARFMGRAALAGMLILGATGALAAGDSGLVVSQQHSDMRVVEVPLADLDLAKAYDRDTLTIRIRNAARHVCDISRASKFDRMPAAQACFAEARAGALAQLDDRGLSTSPTLAVVGRPH